MRARFALAAATGIGLFYALLALISVLLVLLLASAAQASQAVALHSDTYVRSDYPNTNFASDSALSVDGTAGALPTTVEPVRISLLYFPNVPTSPISAKLSVYVTHHTGEPFQVRTVTCQGWTAATVTYNTRPALGAVVATIADDTEGWHIVGVPIVAGSNCFALTKDGKLWMTLSSKEGANPPGLVVETSTAPPPPPPTTPVDDCSGGAVVSATPSTLATAVASSSRVIVNAQPGSYGHFSRYPSSTQGCVKIRCTVAAKTGNIENSGGCRALNQWGAFGNIKNLTIEGFHFVTGDDYGLQFYNENPYVSGAAVRVADNVFHGNMAHDISTKSRVDYAEVLGNLFISCGRHCWEIGQNGNIRSRPSTTQYSLFKGNTVSSRIQGVTNRANVRLDVVGNAFGSVAGYAVISQAYWALYPFGASWDDGRLMVPGTLATFSSSGTWTGYTAPVPLRTNIVGNSFSSGNRLTFEGRGVIDDVVKVQGNTGTRPSCSRVNMPSGTASAHANEQTTAPPRLDSTSDIPC